MKIVECHYYHIISKITLCSLIFIIFILICDKILVIISLDFKQGREICSIYYFQNTFEIDKMLSILFSSFIYGHSFMSEQDSYRSFIIVNGISRIKYIFSKFITILLIIFFYISILFISFYVIGLTHNLMFQNDIISAYVSLFIATNFYGLISTLLIQLFNNFYLVLIPFIVYILATSITIENNLLAFFILLINESGLIINGYIFSLIYILLFLFINIIIFMNKDLPTQ